MKEFRVRWQREGHDVRTHVYQTRPPAERLMVTLQKATIRYGTGFGPDGETEEIQLAPLEFVELQERTVTRWRYVR